MSSTATQSPLIPELAGLCAQFAAAKADAGELVQGLNESQFNWRPPAGGWSIAECLLHLNIVGDFYVKVLEKHLEEARARGRVGHSPLRHGFLNRWILKNTEPPPKRKFKVPRSFTPPDGQPLTAVLPTFLHLQDQLTRQVEQANGLDLARIMVPAPELGPLRFHVYFSFVWIASHQRRHLWQARRVRQDPAFPRN